MKPKSSPTYPQGLFRLIIISGFILLLFAGAWQPVLVYAQNQAAVQSIENQLYADDLHIYQTTALQEGDILHVYLQSTSGNLDPFVGITYASVDPGTLRETFEDKIQTAAEQDLDVVTAITEFADQSFLAWDDDSGEGYNAKLSLDVPENGEYILVVIDSPLTASSGNYSLLLGLNEPGVLTGEASPNGETIAIFQREASEYGRAVERISGTLGALDETDNANFYNLVTLLPGDTLYAYVEGTSGNLVPTMELRDFGGKPINTANFFGNDKYGSLQHTFDELSSGYSLWVESFKEGEVATVGDYRLVIGVNEPSVLNGKGETTGFKIINEPIDVNIGIKIDQITDIDQQAENFTVVAELDMEWQDSNLAFNPDTCQCSFKAFTQKTFDDFIELAEGNWPDFTFFNQQGNRWTQNRAVVVFPEGSARYFERFTTTFQAPDFKFSQFPFDKQQFYVRLRSLFPEEFYSYQNNQEITGMGDQLGEEEWIVTETETTITYEDNSPQFNFRFEAKRYLTFYITRIFIPLILIIIVAWITFFLKDYGKRVDVTAGNLLLFIAYNFTIANDLPRLGYLTFFDKVLISTFFISVLMVVYNVILKRLEVSDREETAHKIDRYMIWIYPVVYLLAFLILWVSTF